MSYSSVRAAVDASVTKRPVNLCRSHESSVPAHNFPRGRESLRTVDVVDQPPQLARRKIRVESQPSLARHELANAASCASSSISRLLALILQPARVAVAPPCRDSKSMTSRPGWRARCRPAAIPCAPLHAATSCVRAQISSASCSIQPTRGLMLRVRAVGVRRDLPLVADPRGARPVRTLIDGDHSHGASSSHMRQRD